jgi:hypothetical protein
MTASTDSSPPQIVFLLSSPRSGSTLVSRVLDSHSKIASPCEICIPYIVFPNRKALASFRKLRQICSYYQAQFPRIAWSLFWRPLAWKHLQHMAKRIAEVDGKAIVVVKDPRHTLTPERIESLCGQQPPRYLLLYRDVRAVAYSYRHTLQRSYDRAFEIWSRSTEGMLRVEREISHERWTSLRFEDFQANPAAAIKRLMPFFGTHFELDMLDYGRFPHADDKMKLWGNQKLVTSVNKGVIKSEPRASWHDDAQLAAEYAACREIVALNERLGYGSKRAAA